MIYVNLSFISPSSTFGKDLLGPLLLWEKIYQVLQYFGKRFRRLSGRQFERSYVSPEFLKNKKYIFNNLKTVLVELKISRSHFRNPSVKDICKDNIEQPYFVGSRMKWVIMITDSRFSILREIADKDTRDMSRILSEQNV